MKRNSMAWLSLIAVAGLTNPAMAEDPVPGDGPGWTGNSTPEDVIAARQALMMAIEALMLPIDTYTVDGKADPTALTDAARSIAAMLLATPHLFPPTTTLSDAAVATPETLALPKIWQEFPTFYTMAAAASSSATEMAETVDAAQLRTAGLKLRASCDACHALYLRPYVRAEVSQEDLDFDFDSVLPAQ
jgi:cytochrome c556